MLVKCKISKQVFANGDFRIFGATPLKNYEDLKLNKYLSFTIKGNYPFLTEGKEYELEIEELSTDSYGTSYKVISVPSVRLDLDNLSFEDSMSIMRDVTSSERLATNILVAYPNFIKIILEKGKSEIDLKKIKGVGEAYLSCYERILNEKYKYLAFMNKYKIFELDVSECKSLFDKFLTEDKIDEMLNNKPYYSLIEVVGRSFNKVDALLLNIMPNLKDSDQRCEALIMEILRRNEIDGSSRLGGSVLYQVVKDEYNADELIPKLKVVSENSELIYFDEKTKDLSLMSTYIAEKMVTDFVTDRVKNSTELDNIDISKYTNIDGFEMTKAQSEALSNLCKYNISILCGFSGSGKTASTKGLIALMEDNGLTYTMVSPTGKASRVLVQATNRKATTIHRKCLGDGEINTDVLIVDECSMISLEVFTMLINAITNENIRVVLVGDSSQLVPIGVGKIFSDLIVSDKVPKIMLTDIFRYKENGSLFVATNLRQGKSFFNDKDMVKVSGNVYSVANNYKFINVPQDEVFDNVINEYRKLINKNIKQEDIQIYSPFNVGTSGTYAINNEIQAEFNPPKGNEMSHTRKIGKTNVTFRLNDLVINKKNDYSILTYNGYLAMQDSCGILLEDDVEKSVVLNGQVGKVREVLNDGLVIQFDEELLFFGKGKLNNLLLAYAISTHSSQGSSVPYSISIVSKQHQKMLCKELLYVADTRCRKAHIDIGDIDTFTTALTVSQDSQRNTWLLDMLEENFN